jgi:hypothetical protein
LSPQVNNVFFVILQQFVQRYEVNVVNLFSLQFHGLNALHVLQPKPDAQLSFHGLNSEIDIFLPGNMNQVMVGKPV